MLLHPDDGLGEVEARCLQGRRVVPAVPVPAPDIEGTAGKEDTGDVPKPGPEHLLVSIVVDEVVCERSVLRPEAPCRGLGLLGVPGEIKLLVMHLLKGAIPRGNGII